MATKAKKVNLSNYTKGRRLGEGAFGSVYLCTEKATGFEYAAKISIVQPNSEFSPDHYFNREVETLSAVNHQSVIRLEGYSLTDFEGNNNPVILTRYMNGGNLMQAILKEQAGTPIPKWSNTVKQIIFVGLACGMKAIHKAHIIHRDFKPANILLDSALYPHIIDFGLAKVLDPSGSVNMSTFLGTQPYMATELFNGDDYDIPVDVYAFGITLYELLCARRAYANPAVIMSSAINNKRPKFVDFKCPKAFQDLITRCWDQDPQRRPTFDQIYDEILHKPELILPDVDMNQYNLFCKDLRIRPASLSAVAGRVSPVLPIHATPVRLTQTLNLGTRPVIKPKKVPKDKVRSASNTASASAPPSSPSLTQSVDPAQLRKLMANPRSLDAFGDTIKKAAVADTTTQESLKQSVADSMSADSSSFLTVSKRGALSKLKGLKIPDEPDPSLPADILFIIGSTYEHGGLGHGVNYKKMAAFYKLAAEKGSKDAMLNLANYLRDDEKFEEALKYYKMACDHGNIDAYVNYANMLEDGEGCEKDKKLAFKYFTKAAEAGLRLGYLHAARFLIFEHEALGIERDLNKAIEYLEKILAPDQLGAHILIACAYLLNDQPEKSYASLKIAADEGVVFIQLIYGLMLLSNDRNDEGVEYLDKAADNGCVDAMLVLGSLYDQGEKVEKDLVKSTQYFKNAALSNNEHGLIAYGICLINGDGCEPDPETGAEFIRQAAKDGSTKACKVLFIHAHIKKDIELKDEDSEYHAIGLIKLVAELNEDGD